MASAQAGVLHPGVVRVLDHDPELADEVESRTAEIMRRQAVARLVELSPGPWEAPTDPAACRGHLGLLVLEGALTRDMVIARTACAELLGPGDVLRPWDMLEEGGPVAARVTWEVLTPVRIAVLDRDFAATVGRVPELTTAIVGRSVRRARWLALHLAIRCLKRVDARLLALFWHLADRFGRVTPEGIVVPLDVTHARLGRLVGAQRPSVTTALGELAGRGLVRRREDGSWLLRGDLPTELERLGGRRATSTRAAGRPASA
jgi:CRP/FNR family cyclic AMP-dependent transcriptional regulator